MKTTVVPAQITTVEDKIAGNLSFNQLLLMTTPVFISGAMFAFLPPFLSIKSYKLMVCSLLAITCLTLAIRIRGKIVLSWISIIGRYNLRPRYYLFNKNNNHLRFDAADSMLVKFDPPIRAKKNKVNAMSKELSVSDIIKLEMAFADPRAKFYIKTNKKGALNVYIQEIK